jgi:outer membrane protein assembly factor BamB
MTRFAVAASCLVALLSSGVARADDVPPLAVRWTIPSAKSSLELHLLVSRDKREVIVGGPGSVTARSTSDGKVLWQRSDLRAPIALANERVVAVSPKREIVGVDVETGHELWRTKSFEPYIVSFAADGDLVVAGLDPDQQTDAPDLLHGTTLALAAASGTVLWSRRGDMAYSGWRTVLFLGSLIAVSYDAVGEPGYYEVNIFDHSTGKKLLEDDRAAYSGRFGNELWLSQAENMDPYPPVKYDRYRASDLSRLSTYSYAPEPESVAQEGARQAGEWAPTALTDRYVFVGLGGRLYRYDRGRPPADQTPQHYDVPGVLAGAIGESPMFVQARSALILVPTDADRYATHLLDLSGIVSAPIIDAKTIFPSSTISRLADSAAVSWFTIEGTLLAMTPQGDAFFLEQPACPKASAVAVLSETDAIALCDGVLARLSLHLRRS